MAVFVITALYFMQLYNVLVLRLCVIDGVFIIDMDKAMICHHLLYKLIHKILRVYIIPVIK